MTKEMIRDDASRLGARAANHCRHSARQRLCGTAGQGARAHDSCALVQHPPARCRVAKLRHLIMPVHAELLRVVENARGSYSRAFELPASRFDALLDGVGVVHAKSGDGFSNAAAGPATVRWPARICCSRDTMSRDVRSGSRIFRT